MAAELKIESKRKRRRRKKRRKKEVEVGLSVEQGNSWEGDRHNSITRDIGKTRDFFRFFSTTTTTRNEVAIIRFLGEQQKNQQHKKTRQKRRRRRIEEVLNVSFAMAPPLTHSLTRSLFHLQNCNALQFTLSNIVLLEYLLEKACLFSVFSFAEDCKKPFLSLSLWLFFRLIETASRTGREREKRERKTENVVNYGASFEHLCHRWWHLSFSSSSAAFFFFFFFFGQTSITTTTIITTTAKRCHLTVCQYIVDRLSSFSSITTTTISRWSFE